MTQQAPAVVERPLELSADAASFRYLRIGLATTARRLTRLRRVQIAKALLRQGTSPSRTVCQVSQWVGLVASKVRAASM